MSSTVFPLNASNFVASDEDLNLHRIFSFANTEVGTGDDAPLPVEDILANPTYFCSPVWPLKNPQGQPVNWLPPSLGDAVDEFDTLNFDEFLAPDDDTEDLAPTAETTLSSPPPVGAGFRTAVEQHASAPELTVHPQASAKLDAAQVEVAQLKAALVAEGFQQQLPGAAGSHQSSSARKRALTGGDTSPPKRQSTTEKGPIEALWEPLLNKDRHGAKCENLASPKTSPIHHDVTPPPSTAYLSNSENLDFSPQDILALQNALEDDCPFAYDITRADTPTPATMAHSVHTRIKHTPAKQARACTPKVTKRIAGKSSKKPRATPKKTQHQRTASTAPSTSPPASSPPRHRSIDELLSANFYSLNEQEKTRLLLPMLRNLDPRELESSLAELPCIQAKGPGHEQRVANAIRNSPPTEENDDELATKLTFGTSPSPLLTFKPATFTSPTPPPHASSLLRKVAHVEASEELHAISELEALDEAVVWQVQSEK